MKRAFTLIEVTMAMGILATGILAVVGLYALGFRESSQSREDVAAAAAADIVLGQLAMAVSSTNVSWKEFARLGDLPSSDGWGAYVENKSTGRIMGDPTTRAADVFDRVMNLAGLSGSFPSAMLQDNGLKCGLVVMHAENSPVVAIGFRAMNRSQDLFAVPLFYTEARYQGVRE